MPFIDVRDGKSYNTVLIGTQCWMKENLNYQTASGSFCYDNNPSNCNTYGRLYYWDVIMNGENSSNSIPSGVQGICPTGWHIPSDAEIGLLSESLGGGAIAGKKMKDPAHWDPTYANNESGFSALPGGLRLPPGYCESVGDKAYFWASSWFDNGSYSGGDFYSLENTSNSITRFYFNSSGGMSVRCLKN
jgi:uncharacterized protein (TIGR02145 family)